MHVEFIVFMYVSIYFDMFYIVWSADQKGSMEFELKWSEVKCAHMLLFVVIVHN
jgi:hypothetical protein